MFNFNNNKTQTAGVNADQLAIAGVEYCGGRGSQFSSSLGALETPAYRLEVLKRQIKNEKCVRSVYFGFIRIWVDSRELKVLFSYYEHR